MTRKKINATFIGDDMRLETNHNYDIELVGNLATIHREGKSDVICPYDTICAFFNNWCNIEVSGVKVPKNYKPEIGDYMSNEYGVGGYMDDKSIIDS